MNFIFTAVGSVGDVYPYLAVARGLKRRGRAVQVIANPYYEKAIVEAGLDFLPVGTVAEQEELIHHPKAWHPRKCWKYWVLLAAIRPMRQIYDVIVRNAVPGQTVTIGGWSGIAARIAQETLGISMASLHVEPDKLRTAYQPPILPSPMFMRPWTPRWWNRTVYWLADRKYIDRNFGPPINAFRQELGLAPVRRLWHEWIHSPECVIGLFPDWWASPQPDWPPQAALTGFPLWDGDKAARASDDVQQFLEDGDPPIVVSPGALNPFGRRFFEIAADACRLLRRRGLLLSTHDEIVPPHLPSGVRHFRYVPFGTLLPCAAAMVHHAGTGTSAQCLAAGVPQILLPVMYPHPDTAARLERLGVGVARDARRITAPELATVLKRVLASLEIQENCRRMARRIQAARPIDNTCDILERMLARQPVPRLKAVS